MKKFLEIAIKTGLFLIPFIPLVVARSLVFPFITGKHFAFRILVEILALLWLVLMLKYQSGIPKKSPIIIAVSSFILVLGLADLFGIEPYRSFWSNYERMEGFIGLLHFFLYFLILSSVFTRAKEWLAFFYTSLGVSVVISIYGLFQLAGKLEIHQSGTRLDGTLGNATYLAVYLLFHLFLFMFLFLRTKVLWQKILFASVFLLESFVLYYTATRGAILAFFISLVILAVTQVWQLRGRPRLIAATAMALLILVPVVFYAIRDTNFVKQSEVLSRIRNISFSEQTTQSRIIIWSMAWNGWKERPILGWGQENFSFVFSKHYDPRLWKQEPWFDRAHNVFFDWLMAGGIVGLAAYLSIFGAVFWTMRTLVKRGVMTSLSFSLFSALFFAYFLQNFFVFDQFASYFLFFSFTGYLHAMYATSNAPSAPKERRDIPVNSKVIPTPLASALMVVLIPAFLFAIYKVNIKPYLVARGIIEALSAMSHKSGGPRDVSGGVEIYQKAMSLNTFGTTEIRDQITQAVTVIVNDNAVPQADKEKFVRFAVEQLEQQKNRFPYDMRAKAFLGNIYNVANLTDKAIQVTQEALNVSSKRQLFYFVMAEAYLNKGDYDQAREILKKAYELDPSYDQALHNLALVTVASGHPDEAESLLIRSTGKPYVPDRRYVNAYIRINALDRVSRVWEELIKSDPANTDNYINLAALLVKRGLRQDAIGRLEEAKALKPSLSQDIDKAIEQIKSGSTTQL